jgi:ATP-dependent RNA helicase DDX51/DBP6
MYSRYIPPPKGGSVKPVATAIEPSTQSRTPAVEGNEKKRKLRASDNSKEGPEKTTEGIRVEKIRKKKSRRTREEEVTVDSDAEEGENVPVSEPAVEKKKKKKKDKKSRGSLSDEPTTADLDAHVNSERRGLIDEDEGGDSEIVNEEQTQVDSKYKSVLSKFEKSSRIAAKKGKKVGAEEVDEMEGIEYHNLTPLPQPIAPPAAKPTFSGLPPWLAKPIVVDSTTTTPFKDLRLHEKLVGTLEGKGYKDAFAIQSTLLSMLLPAEAGHIAASRGREGDICVSAATGSGKTLAYVLPIIENLRGMVVTRLRALIVVPTRELVNQVQKTCEMCVVGTGLKVGTAVGSHTMQVEREALVHKGEKWDPEGYENVKKEIQRLESEGVRLGAKELDELLDELEGLPNHTLDYTSKVDILIATPGRLVDHIKRTKGFNLENLQWLVIDEADRLLSQSFQEWTEVVLAALKTERNYSELKADQKLLTDMGFNPSPREIRKIILSATMTRDVGKLQVLQLKKPKLIVVGNAASRGEDITMDGLEDEEEELADAEENYNLPPRLEEWAIAVEDGSEKPLFLLKLLKEKIFASVKDKISASSSDSSSDLSSDSSSSESDSGESSDSSEDSTSDSSSSSSESNSETSTPTPDPRKATPKKPLKTPQKVLIFTASNASALRLARLLALLHPAYAPLTSTLTSVTPSSSRNAILRSFASKNRSILIASDLVSRGLDLPDLPHIVNYDLPTSVRAYVHRVGRTARAGKKGEAWTLFTEREGAWFWNGIARAKDIDRGGKKVGRLNYKLDDAVKEQYEEALTALGEEVRGA